MPPQLPVNLPDDVLAAIGSDPELARWWQARNGFWGKFKPRPDNPAQHDQQHSFCYSRDLVSFLIKGNAAGGTEAAAFKTALFVLQQQAPPRHNTPFWIISDTYDQTCETCWVEKLHGHGHIPDCEIDWDGIRWKDTKRGWPFSVPLKPWPDRPGKNWILEFKSYEQGRRAMQARSIGGFWFTEQFPQDLFTEVLRGCREYMFPGGQFCEFTPIDPELSVWLEAQIEKPPHGWAFYRANTECNRENLAEEWFDQFFATVPDELQATRKTGAFASFEGLIYQSFNPAVHVIDQKLFKFPRGVHHYRGVDWGASAEHPFACVWGYQDGLGDWWIYDEYLDPGQDRITADYAAEIQERWPWPEESEFHGATFADPSRPGELNEFNQRGIYTVSAINAVYKGINCLRSLFKINATTNRPRIYLCKQTCPNLVAQLRKYRWMRGRKPGSGPILNPAAPAPKPLKKDDDLPDALRYMVTSVESGQGGELPGSMRQDDQARRRRSVQLAPDNKSTGSRFRRSTGLQS